MFQNPSSFEGRIRRKEYGISLIIYAVADVFFTKIVNIPDDAVIDVLHIIAYILMLWFILEQGAKRCHDLGKSGWWQLIPFYGFWMLFQNGQSGSNQYGENPKN